MKQPDLVAGFQKVDQAQADFLIKFLSDVGKFPSIVECFNQQLKWLDIQPGFEVLDVGCGIGDQAAEFAKLVGEIGKVTGTDLSETMVKISTERFADSGLPLSFQVASANKQPFPNESFDRIRTERVLMYVPNLAETFQEFYRLLKPGGKLLVVDFDWDTLSIAHSNKELNRKIIAFISDSFPNGRIGAELPKHFENIGLKDIKIKPVGYLANFEFTKRFCVGTLTTGVEKGVFDEAEINEWWQYLEQEEQKGSFLACFNGFIVMGAK